MLAIAGIAFANGEFNIYNWGNYTSPELIKKFEETHKVKVTVTDYDSNDIALARFAPAAMATTSSCHLPVSCRSGSSRILLETRPDQMENFKNVDDRSVTVALDPGRRSRCLGSGARPASTVEPRSTQAT